MRNGTSRSRSSERSFVTSTLVSASLLALVIIGVAPEPTAVARTSSTPVVVTLGFDDGTLDQFVQAFPILQAHAMHATFFINTGPILAGDPGHMTWADLTTMYSAGQEIGGHTVDHANLQPLPPAEAEHQVCDDRNTLLAHGFAPESFAYPFGSWNTTSEAVAHYCGYNSARTVSGITKRHSGPFGETLPRPIRSPPARRPTRRRPPSSRRSSSM